MIARLQLDFHHQSTRTTSFISYFSVRKTNDEVKIRSFSKILLRKR